MRTSPVWSAGSGPVLSPRLQTVVPPVRSAGCPRRSDAVRGAGSCGRDGAVGSIRLGEKTTAPPQQGGELRVVDRAVRVESVAAYLAAGVEELAGIRRDPDMGDALAPEEEEIAGRLSRDRFAA